MSSASKQYSDSYLSVYRATLGKRQPPGSGEPLPSDVYFRPDGASYYLRPDGISYYGRYQSVVVPTYDSDAEAHFAAVAAIGSNITPENKTAINAFIVGCKADASPNGGVSNWTAMKSACLLAGADNLEGALIPLKGTAPTNTGFLSTHYSRTAGLSGNQGRQLASNRLNNADPQNNRSRGLYLSSVGGANSRFMSAGTTSNFEIITSATSPAALNPRFRGGSTTIDTLTVAAGIGLIGVNRVSSTEYEASAWGTQSTITRTSSTPSSGGLFVFSSGGANYITGTVQFYWIGEAVNMALLSTRLATLMAALT